MNVYRHKRRSDCHKKNEDEEEENEKVFTTEDNSVHFWLMLSSSELRR